jgi:hypothetical protein
MKLRSLLLIAFVPALLTSCLKSKDSLGVIADDGSITTGIFDRFYYGQTKSFALTGSPAIETIDLLDMRYSAPRKKAGAIHVKLAVDNTLVTAYNTANGTSFVALPTNAYTLPTGLEFDFQPGGEGRYNFQLTLNKNNLNLQNAYAIGFKLVSVSEGVIDANQKDVICTILVKNKYDGIYEINGTFSDAARPDFAAIYPLEWQLVTTGPATCKVQDAVNFGTPTPAYLFYVTSSSSYSYYGSFGLVINFDANDNVSSVSNFYGQPSGNGRSANLDPSGINKYLSGNPASIKVKYWMDQPSVITPHRGYFDETWTYLGPR